MAELFELAKNIILKPSILKPQSHIFLLSHMRANTSLLGHILGEHLEINGYYEMHIGYYSWKSLVRQKSKYFKLHLKEPVKQNIFDKILHDGHEVSDYMLHLKSAKFLMSIREPEISVKSAVAMFRKNSPNHEFAEQSNVCDYYIKRLNTLASYSEKLKNRFFYYDAKHVIERPTQTLNEISEFLELTIPLKEHFKPKTLTGIGDGGDHTGNLLSGNIIKKINTYDEIELSSEQVTSLMEAYKKVRNSLIKNAINKPN